VITTVGATRRGPGAGPAHFIGVGAPSGRVHGRREGPGAPAVPRASALMTRALTSWELSAISAVSFSRTALYSSTRSST